jgi:group I intron endonuclease
MIGIYKITKKENGKSYIGQSNDIERRFAEHISKDDIPVEVAISKHGSKVFTFEVLEECALEELDEREIYWIAHYNTYKGFGYNCNPGGGNSRGENNGRAKLTNEEVAYIRECYDSHMRRRDVYKGFKDRISFSAFASIWDGTTWKDIKPEVYTEENKKYYMYEATNGQNSAKAVLSDEEVMECRERYVSESAKEIYQDYQDRISYQTLQQILWGRTYKHLPVYKKKTREWINK